MMEVLSACELRPGWVLWQTARGALTLTVVAKATYKLRAGQSPLAANQDDPVEADDHWNDDEQRSLRAASDLVPFKARADVLLVGRAFAPGGQPARSLVARLQVAGVDKGVEIFCDRAFCPDGALREGPPFVTMPLHWERAAGGPGTVNPVGVRPDGPRDAHGSLPLPNLQPPGLRVQGPGDFIPPIGFGPVAPTWPPRWGRFTPHDLGWDHRRWHRRPLPPDLDRAFFSVAPADQQVDVLRPDERIVLEHLHPRHPRLVTSLVKVTPRLIVERGGASQEIGMRCDTLVIDTERRLCTLTWRAQIPIDDPRRPGRVVITTSAPGQRRREQATLSPTRAPSAAALPFEAGSARRRPPAPPPAKPDQTLDAPLSEPLPVLPFRVGRSPLAGTVLGGQPASAPPPPPGTPLPPPVTPLPPPVTPLPPPVTPLPPPVTPLPPALIPHPPPIAPQAVWSEPAPVLAPPPARTPEPIPTPRPLPPDPPPSQPPPDPPPAGAPPPAEPETAPGPEALPIEEYPIERCAAIAARLAHGKEERASILEAERLSPDRWTRLHRHWLDHVRAAEERGQMGPSALYDDAYVAALEAARGPMTPDEYARLLVATERGRRDEALAALDLPKSAFLRVQRVWLRRTATDAELGKAARQAIDAARRV
ncbi:MAG: DUF2169 domain-containing protein [Polyangiaceae bacterium]|nr:DUF2169 domain-containing protein [Polyangiaceae bacterium]